MEGLVSKISRVRWAVTEQRAAASELALPVLVRFRDPLHELEACQRTRFLLGEWPHRSHCKSSLVGPRRSASSAAANLVEVDAEVYAVLSEAPTKR